MKLNVWTLLICMIAVPALANIPPPAKREITRAGLSNLLKEKKLQTDHIRKDIQTLNKDIKSNRLSLIHVGREIQAMDAKLWVLEKDIKSNEAHLADLTARLLQDKDFIGDLIFAFYKLETLPPALLALKPNAPVDAAQTALLLQHASGHIAKHAHHLRTDIKELERLNMELSLQRDKAMRAATHMQERRNALRGFVREKEGLYLQSQQRLEAYAQEIKQLTAKAQTMDELMKQLEDAKRRVPLPPSPVARGSTSDNIGHKGVAQLPLSGIIRVTYGGTDHLDARSDGLWIEGRPGALITAPMNGVVRYAGDFRQYGSMVILEHADGYHSLVAGFEKIDTVVGHRVSAGEPLGYLSQSPTASGKSLLYFELRHNGKAINPGKTIVGIS